MASVLEAISYWVANGQTVLYGISPGFTRIGTLKPLGIPITVFFLAVVALVLWYMLDHTPAGRFLYCCNQRGDNVTTFRVDRKSGGLGFTDQYTPVGNPSCIVFLDLNKRG